MTIAIQSSMQVLVELMIGKWDEDKYQPKHWNADKEIAALIDVRSADIFEWKSRKLWIHKNDAKK